MKLRHAAALALVGWYLMNPPFSQWLHYQGVAGYGDAPLRDWQRFKSFNTKQDCDEMVGALRNRFDKNPHESIKNRAQYDPRLAVCIASDDPRLKEN